MLFFYFRYVCILCQEESSLFSSSKDEADALIMAAHVQKTAVLSGDTNFYHAKRGKCTDQEFLPLDLGCGPLTSSCGHAMHASCYQKFFDSLIEKEREREYG